VLETSRIIKEGDAGDGRADVRCPIFTTTGFTPISPRSSPEPHVDVFYLKDPSD
jgi:hypothetical protein